MNFHLTDRIKHGAGGKRDYIALFIDEAHAEKLNPSEF